MCIYSNLDSTFDVLILVHVSHGFLCYTALKNDKLDIEDITRRPEDMNFSFSVISSMYNQYGNRGLFFVGSLYTVVCPPQEKHQLCLKRSERLRTSDSKKGKSRKERNYTALCSDVL